MWLKGAVFVSRKAAKFAKAAGFLCLFFVFLSATLSQRLWVLVTLRLLFSFVSFVVNVLCVFLAEAQGSLRLCSAVLVLCVLRLRFRRDCVC